MQDNLDACGSSYAKSVKYFTQEGQPKPHSAFCQRWEKMQKAMERLEIESGA